MKLTEWAKGHNHKYLICDNIANGKALIKKYNKKDIIFSNLSVVSIFDIAKEILVNDLAKNGLCNIKFIDSVEKEVIIDNILKANDYSFVHSDSYCDETTKEIINIMDAIRSGKINDDSLFNKPKLKSIKKLIDDYIKETEKNNIFDEISTITLATNILKKSGFYKDGIFAIIEYYNNNLTYVESEFISSLNVKDVIEYKEINKCNNKGFYEVYGAFNEVDFVLDDIIAKKLNMGDVLILVPSGEYTVTLMSAMANRGLPYSICLSYGIKDNDLIMLLMDIIHFASNNYQYTDFAKIINNPLINLNLKYFENKDNKYINDTTYNLGKSCGMLYSLDRYKLFVRMMKENKIEYLKLIYKYENKFLSRYNEEEIKESLNDKLDLFVDFIDNLISIFTNPSRKTGDILSSILNLNIKGCKLIDIISDKNKYEKNPAYEAVFELNKSLKLTNESISFNVALKELETKLLNLMATDEEDSSKILVKKAGNTLVVERNNIYILGMSFDSFVPKTTESPILSDDELIELLDKNYNLPLASQKPINKNEGLFNTLDTINENSFITITRPSYDTRGLRLVPPAPIYNDLLGKNIALKIDKYLHLSNYDMTYDESFDQDYSSLGEGVVNKIKFVDIINEGNHTIYNLNHNYRLTPSEIEALVGCRLKYLYNKKYFDSEVVIDYSCWLQANKLGDLYHNTLEEYCNMYLVNRPSKDLPLDYLKDEFDSIFIKNVEEFKIIYPSPSDKLIEITVNDAKKNLTNYLSKLYKDLKENHYMIYGCEVELGKFFEKNYPDKDFNDIYFSFNMDGEIFDEKEKSPNKETSELRVFFKPSIRIDRIDYNEETKKFRIIDYKSGSVFSNSDFYKKVQWLVYSYYVGNTEKFQYEFVRKNENIIIDDPANLNNNTKIINKLGKILVDLFVKGNVTCACFTDEDNSMACKYCDYSDICAGKLGMILEDGIEEE